jgi:hypothetical protein
MQLQAKGTLPLYIRSVSTLNTLCTTHVLKSYIFVVKAFDFLCFCAQRQRGRKYKAKAKGPHHHTVFKFFSLPNWHSFICEKPLNS